MHISSSETSFTTRHLQEALCLLLVFAFPALFALAEVSPLTSASVSGTAQSPNWPPNYPAGSVAFCGTNSDVNQKSYITSTFDPRGVHTSVIELAYQNYLYNTYHVRVTATCQAKTQHAAEANLNAWKQEAAKMGTSSKMIDTGWSYHGPEPGPFMSGEQAMAARNAAQGQWVLCVSDYAQPTVYVSSNFHIDEPFRTRDFTSDATTNKLRDLKAAFLSFLQKQYGYRSTSAYPADCSGYQLESDVTATRDNMRIRKDLKFVETGWTPLMSRAAPAAAAQAPVAPTDPYKSFNGVYTGTYTCNKGPVDLRLNLTLSGDLIRGTFTFFLPPGSHSKAYTFSLNGHINTATGAFSLAPLKWEGPEPPNFMMVGLKGTADPKAGKVFGTIDYSGCGRFEAMKGRDD